MSNLDDKYYRDVGFDFVVSPNTTTIVQTGKKAKWLTFGTYRVTPDVINA